MTPRAAAVTPSSSAAPSTPVSRAPVAPVTAPAPGNGSTADRAAAETVFRTYVRAVADGDFAMADELGLKLERTKTCMAGDGQCNFCYHVKAPTA